MEKIVDNEEYEIVCPIANFGFLIRHWEKYDVINYDGKPDISLYDKYNILTNKNDILLKNWVNDISFKIENNYCIFGINNNNKYGVFDLEGNLLAKPIYDKIYYDSDDIFMAVANHKFGYLDSKGQKTPIIFADASFFYEDYAAVKYNYKWGFINKNTIIDDPDSYEQYTIPPQYNKVDDFENGICKVRVDEDIFYIDKSGNKVEQKIKTKH